MINQTSVERVKISTYKIPQWRSPRYDDYCFSQLPNTILKLLGQAYNQPLPQDTLQGLKENYSTVVLLFLDAFGWNFFNRCLEMNLPALKRFVEDGNVSLITSLFPSTTAAHVHTLNMGIPPSQTGIYEWRMYEQLIDLNISPLLFSRVDDIHGKDQKGHNRDTLLQHDIDPAKIFSPSLFYQSLLDQDLEIYTIDPSEFMDASYNRTVTPQPKRIGYDYAYEDPSTGLKTLYDLVTQVRGNQKTTFVKFYSPLFDSKSHKHGPDSEELNNALNSFFTSLENNFLAPLANTSVKGNDIAVLICADHGHIGINPDETVYLDENKPEIIDCFKTTQSGIPIFPCGFRRDLFLHVKQEKREQLCEELSKDLDGIAKVFKIEQVRELFGPWQWSEKFSNNVGNVLILPLENQGVFLAGTDGKYKKRNIGEHGGLSPEEMEIPFAVLSL